MSNIKSLTCSCRVARTSRMSFSGHTSSVVPTWIRMYVGNSCCWERVSFMNPKVCCMVELPWLKNLKCSEKSPVQGMQWWLSHTYSPTHWTSASPNIQIVAVFGSAKVGRVNLVWFLPFTIEAVEGFERELGMGGRVVSHYRDCLLT